MANAKRTALLIRCSVEEAEIIRRAARLEGRTLSSYVLRAVMNRVSVQNLAQEWNRKRIGSQGR